MFCTLREIYNSAQEILQASQREIFSLSTFFKRRMEDDLQHMDPVHICKIDLSLRELGRGLLEQTRSSNFT